MSEPLLWLLQRATRWRLARMESNPLGELVVQPADLPILMEFIEEVTGLIDEPTWAGRPFKAPNPSGSRFSDGSYGIFYAGLDLETCLAEIIFHQTQALMRSSAPAMRIHFRALRAKVSGSFVDIRKGHPKLHHMTFYADSQTFGVRAWRAGADGIAYRSVRRPGGECLAVFRKTCVPACHRAGLVALEWDGFTLTAAG